MEIVSRYIREQKRYSKNELKQHFAYDDQGLEYFIKNLKSYGILKSVKNDSEQIEMSDLLNEHIEITDEKADNDKVLYVFNYVGIIIFDNRIIKVYPKYILSSNNPVSQMRQIMKVLEKYMHSQEEDCINLFNHDGYDSSTNLLSLILFFLNDYHEYGVYTNDENIIEVNGEGNILWEKTINEAFTFIIDDRPYYMELYTEKIIDNDTCFFKRLHECILTECSQQLRESQLEDIFEMIPVNLSEESVSDFGNSEYILSRIKDELSIQFNTRKQILLKTMYAYVLQNKKMIDENKAISLYGTSSFHVIWEKACSEVFNNQINTPLEKIKLSLPLSKDYDPRMSLGKIVEKSIWEAQEGFTKTANKTLTPDIIIITQSNNQDQLTILDAKYYNLQLEKDKTLKGNPGIGDVTKQYLYQLSYKKFIDVHKINKVRNCFLMPTEQSHIVRKGIVKLEMLKAMELEDIQIRLLPANMIFEHYLIGKKISIKNLEL